MPFGQRIVGPASHDSDGDLFLDGLGCALGTDPANALSYPPVFLSSGTDSDDDGLSDAFEHTIGTDPLKVDGDGDGVNDGVEFERYNTAHVAASKATHEGSLPSRPMVTA